MDLEVCNLILDLQHLDIGLTATCLKMTLFQAPTAGGPAYLEALDDSSCCRLVAPVASDCSSGRVRAR